MERHKYPAPPHVMPHPLDDEERGLRAEIIEEAIRMNSAHGYRIDIRCQHLCERYINGELDIDALRLEVIRPYLH